MPDVCGIHHVKLPVSDVEASRDWYAEMFDFAPTLDFEEEDELLEIMLEHPCGIALLLYHDPERARTIRGFDLFAFAVSDAAELEEWTRHFDARGATCTPIIDAHLGHTFGVQDPDGVVVRMSTLEQPST